MNQTMNTTQGVRILFVRNGSKEKINKTQKTQKIQKRKKTQKKEVRAKIDKGQRICANGSIDM